jgi:hypothetical protein
MNSLTDIYFRLSGKIIVDPSEDTLSADKMATVMKNLSTYGYGLAPSMIQALSDKTIVNFHNVADHMLKTLLGADKHWNPMYPNFPSQVMEMSEAELFLNAVQNYHSSIGLGENWLPSYDKDERPPLADDFEKMKWIELGTMDDFRSVLKTHLASSTEYTPLFRDDIAFLMEEEGSVLAECLPDEFTNKENMAFMVKLLASRGKDFSTFSKTATDVLRIAVALSDGDISLADNTRFRNFKRAERRMLLSMLDRCSNLEEDMLRHRGKWIRLGEYLHPREYSRFSNANRAFHTLRNDPSSIETFNSKTERLLKLGNVREVCDHLKARPSEFARRLNALLSMKKDSEYVIKAFANVARKVSEKVLLEILSYFSSRDVKDLRVFFPKGQIGKAQCIGDQRVELPTSIRTRMTKVINDALLLKYSEKDPLGKVYIDPRLENYIVPFANRSASKALITHTRGSKLDLGATKTVRFFLWWKNLAGRKNRGSMGQDYDSRVDVDLSAAFFNPDWSHHSHVSYTNLRGRGIQAHHSGDITNAPKGACEFIDVDIDSAITGGARYLAMCVYSFSGQPFSVMPECFVGWMERSCPDSGEVFEAKTVKNRVDLDTEAQCVVPMVIDLYEGNVIWMDLALNHQYALHNVEMTKNKVSMLGKALTEMKKPDMYTLISLNAQARGEIVDDPEEADIEFGLPRVRPEDYECL